MTKSLASLSLDLDNKWSYLKVRGDSRWEELPSYFDLVVPRILAAFEAVSVQATIFVVGQDAALSKNHDAIRSLAEAGHEIANHSFHHEPWLHLYTPQQIAAELDQAEDAIHKVTGAELSGFRGPGFSISDDVLQELARRGYRYDATSFPTFLGPLARLFYFLRTGLNSKQREDRKELFGKARDGFQTLRPHTWKSTAGKSTAGKPEAGKPEVEKSNAGQLTRIPVTTMPVLKFPIHASYLMYLREFSPWLARTYFRMAMRMCQLFRVEPSFLLHPLDFLGGDDEKDLAFFPGMKSDGSVKIAFLGEILQDYCGRFQVVTMREHAAAHSEPLPAQPASNPISAVTIEVEESVLTASARENV